jgi:hypothetical protein
VSRIVLNGAWLELVVHSYPYKAGIHMTLLESVGWPSLGLSTCVDVCGDGRA